MFHLLGFVSGGAISWLDHLRWDFAMSTSLFQVNGVFCVDATLSYLAAETRAVISLAVRDDELL